MAGITLNSGMFLRVAEGQPKGMTSLGSTQGFASLLAALAGEGGQNQHPPAGPLTGIPVRSGAAVISSTAKGAAPSGAAGGPAVPVAVETEAGGEIAANKPAAASLEREGNILQPSPEGAPDNSARPENAPASPQVPAVQVLLGGQAQEMQNLPMDDGDTVEHVMRQLPDAVRSGIGMMREVAATVRGQAFRAQVQQPEPRAVGLEISGSVKTVADAAAAGIQDQRRVPAAPVGAPGPTDTASLVKTASAAEHGRDGLQLKPATATPPGTAVLPENRPVDQVLTASGARTPEQAHASEAPAAKAVADQIAAASLRVVASPRGGAVTIQLSPEELGRVEVTITRGDGNHSARVLVERPETLDLVRSEIRHLERSLIEAGLDIRSGSVGVGLRNDNGGHEGSRDEIGNGAPGKELEAPLQKDSMKPRRLAEGRGLNLNMAV